MKLSNIVFGMVSAAALFSLSACFGSKDDGGGDAPAEPAAPAETEAPAEGGSN